MALESSHVLSQEAFCFLWYSIIVIVYAAFTIHSGTRLITGIYNFFSGTTEFCNIALEGKEKLIIEVFN